MGYRSQVAYCIRFVAREDKETHGQMRDSFYTFLAEAKSKEETALCFHDDEGLEIDESKLEIRFFADNVKWYEGYPDVDCHTRLMDLSREWAEEGNEFIGGAFARAGENVEDVVEHSWGTGEEDYGWVGVNRSVYCDWKD